MTIREWAERYCVERGMFPEQANQVVDRVVADPDLKTLQTRWNEDVTGYPLSIRAGLALHLDRHAGAWIEEHLPQAWFKPFFGHTD